MRRTLIWSALLLLLFVWVGYTLASNKKKRIENTPKAERGGAVSVTVAQVARQDLKQPISLIGTVNANADIELYGETAGRVLAVNGKLGDYLPKGAVFVAVDSELQAAALKLAEANLEKAQKDLERYQGLRQSNVGTDQQLDNLKLAVVAAEADLVNARRALANTQIRMPFGGVIASKYVEVGSYLQQTPPTLLANVVDISRLKVVINVSEEDIFRVKPGMAVEVTSSVHPGATYRGTVQAIGAKGDAAHNYPVEVVVANNAANPLKAGMFARVTFTTLPSANALIIPRESLVGSTKDAQVYVVRSGKAYLTPVQVISEVGDRLVVSTGVTEGDAIAVTGLLNLYNEAPVAVIQAAK